MDTINNFAKPDHADESSNASRSPQPCSEAITYQESRFEDSCRVCLQSNQSLEFLFHENCNDLNMISFADRINQCTDIPLITRNDGFPQYICGACLEMLDVTIRFRELCKKSDEEMRAMHHMNELLKEDLREDISHQNSSRMDFEHVDLSSDPILSSVDLYEPYDGPLIDSFDNIVQHKSTEIWSPNKDDRIYTCDKCGEMYASALKLRKHMRMLHKPATTGHLVDSFDDSIYTCEKCGEFYDTAYDLRIHMTIVHRPATRGPFIDSFDKMDHHKSTEIWSPNEDDPIYPCEKCGEIYESAFDLKRHMSMLHKPKTSFPCSICNKTFRNKTYVLIHEKTHSDDRPYKCEICGKTFKMKMVAACHRRTHLDVGKFPCSLCSYRAGSSANLAIHQRRHAGDKPFKCSECPLRFITSSQRLNHFRSIHQNTLEFGRDQCGRFFISRMRLHAHMVVHTGQKPFQCKHCSRRYRYLTCMRRHMRETHADFQKITRSSFGKC